MRIVKISNKVILQIEIDHLNINLRIRQKDLIHYLFSGIRSLMAIYIVLKISHYHQFLKIYLLILFLIERLKRCCKNNF